MLTATQLPEMTTEERRSRLRDLAQLTHGTERGARAQLCRDLGISESAWDYWLASKDAPDWAILLLTAWADLKRLEAIESAVATLLSAAPRHAAPGPD